MTKYNEMSSFAEIQNKINEWSMPPVSKSQMDPMELVKSTAGYAIERHQWTNYHHVSMMTPNKEIQKLFAQISSEEEEHQSMMGSVMDPEITPIEASLGLELTALNGFADAAQLETNENAKRVYDYILLDHLTQTKALSDTASSVGTNPEAVFRGQIRPMDGRPFDRQFIPTNDLFKTPLDKNSDEPASFVHLHSLLAAEEGLRNEFHMIRKMLPSQEVRRLYNMVTAVENLHMVMLGSLHDPGLTPLEYAMINEMAEIRIHQLGAQTAKSDTVKQAHQYALDGDQQHLDWLRDAYAKFEQGDPNRFLIQPEMLFAMPAMAPSDYIMQVVQNQMNMMSKGMGFEAAA